MNRFKPIRKLKRTVALTAIAAMLGGTLLTGFMQTVSAAADPVYRDADAPVERRVADLLARMSLPEKIGQMVQAERKFTTAEDVKTYYIGSLLSGGGSLPEPNTPQAWADMVDQYQRSALQTRLGIPILYGVDAVHGHNNVKGATIFPHNIGIGAANDPALTERIGAATAEEVRATGIHWAFAPTLAVPLDERWGRTYEGFGETPELAGRLGAAYVKGLQGEPQSPGFMKGTKLVATIKHWVGDGATTGGVDQGDVALEEAELEKYMEPYKEAIAAGASSVMVTLSSWKGLKTHGDKYLITDVLKGKLNFDGLVVSDWNGVNNLADHHDWGDPNLTGEQKYKLAVEKSVNAGIDMFMLESWKPFIATLTGLVGEGKVPMSRIDDAVSRILRVKFEAGVFEHPLTDRELLASGSFGSGKHRDIAREAVRKSAVLLKNEKVNGGGQLLPLKKNQRIFVAGRHANDIGLQSGGWTIAWQGQEGDITPGTTIVEGIRKVAPEAQVTYDREGRGASKDKHDVAVVVLGEKPYAEMFGDSQDLRLTKDDIIMLHRVKMSGVPMAVVMISGRPLIVDEQIADWDAFVAAWLPGTEGDGIAQVLFGDYDFTGKLPMSWPWYMEQIPLNVGDANYKPLFEYGFGMSLKDAPKPLPPKPAKPEPQYTDVPASGTTRIEAENYHAGAGVDTENTQDAGGGKNVGWIDPGDWMEYRIRTEKKAAYRIDFRVASQDGSPGAIRAKSGSRAAAADIPRTGGWQNWTTVSAEIVLDAGPQTLRITAGNGGWNFNWFELTLIGEAGPDPGPEPDPSEPPVVVQDAVQVWLSSEKDPSDYRWYLQPQEKESGIAYRLERQANLNLTERGDATIPTIQIDPRKQYQEILGIGTSLEESTIYNLSLMSADKRDQVLKDLLDRQDGAGINFLRISFGSPDFTAQQFYSYNDMPKGETDPALSRFSIRKDIDNHIISTVKRAMEINPDVKFLASPWSPPGWMKTSDSLIAGKLKDEYVDVLAAYYRKAVQAYEDQGIPIYAMTMQNEPLLEIEYPSMGMTAQQQKRLAIALKKELEEHGLSTKLWAFDHNFSDAFSYMTPILSDQAGYDAIDGIAFHDYSGDPKTMTDMHNEYPDKDVMLSERSVWGTAGADRIAQYFRNWAISYNAWVTMLDKAIEPEQWVGTPDPTMLIQDTADRNRYWKLPEYYLTGQFSKFVQRGAKRIESNYGSPNTVTNVAFLNPDDTIVAVVINQTSEDQWFKVANGGVQFQAKLPAKTVGTYLWKRMSEPVAIPARIEAENYESVSGAAVREEKPEGQRPIQYIGEIDDGDWAEYFVNVPEDGEYAIEYRVATGDWADQARAIRLESDGRLVSRIEVPTTWWWSNWRTIKEPVELNKGLQKLRLNFEGGSFNLDWFRLDRVAEPLALPGKIDADRYYKASNAYIEPSAEGGTNVGDLRDGGTLEYRVNVAEAGTYPVSFRVATEQEGASLKLKRGSQELLSVAVPNTGGWQRWETVTGMATFEAGEQTIAIEVGKGFNAAWFAVGNAINATGDIEEGSEDGKQIRVELINNSFAQLGVSEWIVGNLPLGVQAGDAEIGEDGGSATIPLIGNTLEAYDSERPVSVTAVVYDLTATDAVYERLTDTLFFKGKYKETSLLADWDGDNFDRIVLELDGGTFVEQRIGDIRLNGFAIDNGTATVTDVIYADNRHVHIDLKWNATDIRENLRFQVVVPTTAYSDSEGKSELAAELMREGDGGSMPYHPVPGKIRADAYALMSGVTLETAGKEGTVVRVAKRGNWMDYKLDVPAAGEYMVGFRVNSENGAPQGLELRRGNEAIKTLDIMQLWGNWVVLKGAVRLEKGRQTLRLYHAGSGTYDISWLKFEPIPEPHVLPGKIEAEDFHSITHGAIQDGENGVTNLGFVNAGDIIQYKVQASRAGEYEVRYRIATQQSNAKAVMKSGGQTLATTNVTNTGGWQQWQTVSDRVRLSAGVQTIEIEIAGDGFNLDWIEFAYDGGTDPGPGPGPGPDPDPGQKPSQGGGSAGGSGTNANEPGAAKDGIIRIRPTLDRTTGNAKGALTANAVSEALRQARADANGVKTVTVEMEKTAGATSYTLELPQQALASGDTRADRIRVNTELGSFVVSTGMLAGSGLDSPSTIGLTIGKGIVPDAASPDTKGAIGNRPVVTWQVTADGLALDWNNPQAPATITIPYKLKADERNHTEYLKIWLLDEQGKVAAVLDGTYDAELGDITFQAAQKGTYAVAFVYESPVSFDDIDAYPWAKEAIEQLAAKGVLKGTGDRKFAPGADITRADFIVMLVRAFGFKAETDTNFADADRSKYYYDDLAVAKALGIAKGTGDEFRPAAKITRQDMMTLAARALEVAGKLQREKTEPGPSGFADYEQVASYARQSVSILAHKGIVQGDGNRIKPMANATRAEVAVILYRMMQLM